MAFVVFFLVASVVQYVFTNLLQAMIDTTGLVVMEVMLCYSVLKFFTGFVIAVFTACKEIVTNAINKVTTPASANTHQ